MLAVRKTEKGTGAALCQIPVPKPTDSQVLVKIVAAALCKSDLDVINNTESFRLSNVPVPFSMGHEFCGLVVEVGSLVEGISIGDYVCGETHVPCDICTTCKQGRRHLCPDMGLIGRTVDGCFAEYMVLPAVSAVVIPKEIEPETACLFEPFGVAVHAVQEADVSGKTLLITGTGTIGSMALECAANLGAVKIIVTSRDREKLAIAKKLGADAVVLTTEENLHEKVMEITDGEGVDRIIEMTGKSNLFQDGLDVLKPGGKMVCVGNHNQSLCISNFTGRVMYKEITITGIFGRRLFDTWDLAIHMVREGKIDLQKYIGKRLALSAFEDGVESFDQVFGRVVFHCNEVK